MGCEDLGGYRFIPDINESLSEALKAGDRLARLLAEANKDVLEGRIREAHSKATEFIEALKAIGCEHPVIRAKLARGYIIRGLALYYAGGIERAIGEYWEAISILKGIPKEVKGRVPTLWNDLAAAYTNRGNTYSDKGDLDKAIEDYSKAIEIIEHILPRSPEAHDIPHTALTLYYNLGIALLLSGRLEDLPKTLARISQLVSAYKPSTADDARALLNIFLVYTHLEAFSKALDVILSLNRSLKRIDVAKDFKEASKKLLASYSASVFS